MAKSTLGRNVGMRRAAARMCLCFAIAGLSACATKVSLRVPQKAIADLPLERKLVLLDAENGLLAAVDARDAQEEKLFAAGQARRDAQRRLREADDSKDKADVARAQVTEAKARRELADKDRDYQRALLEVAEADLMLADAKFEEARAQQVEGAGLPSGSGVRAADFDEQVAKLQKFRDGKSAKAKEIAAELDKQRAQWDAARGELKKLSFGAQGSVWVE